MDDAGLTPAADDRGSRRGTLAADRPAGNFGAPRTDTRSRVQKVALELFAERLGVTKAALYYHFKSKEDIVHSFTDDYFAEIDDLVDWARDQPRTDATRREILRRYVGIVLGGSEVFRFLHQNQASVQAMESGKDRFARFRGRLDALVDVLAGPGAALRDRVRATAALVSVGSTYMFYLQEVEDPEKLGEIILELATDLTH